MIRITLRRVVSVITLSAVFTFYFIFILQSSLSSRKLEHSVTPNHNQIINKKSLLISQHQLEFYRINKNSYAVSAFTDERNGNMGYKYARVVLIIRTPEEFTCMFGDRIATSVKLYELSENHGKDKQVFILNCQIPNDMDFTDIKHITIKRLIGEESTTIPISYHIPDDKIEKSYPIKMSTCIPSLFGNTYDAKRIIEYVELSIMQGIEQLYIYLNTDDIRDIKLIKTLRHYTNNNIIQLIDMKLPFRDVDIWYHGQLIAVTDCLLRNSGVSKYTFFNDLDEFFVPLTDKSLGETLDKLFVDKKIGSQRTPLKYISTKEKEAPVTLNNVITSSRIERRFTKCVVRPEMVFEQGIHHTSRVIQDDYKTESNDGELLQIYHYKEATHCCDNALAIKNRYNKALRKQFDHIVALLNI